MDRDNYTFATLPSYLRYSRREIAKHDARSSFTSDSAYTNIRQKISAASISVPYEKGLENLRVLNLSRNSINDMEHDDNLNTTIVRLAPISKVAKRRNVSLNRQKKVVNINKADPITYELTVPRARRGSEDGSSVFSVESKQSKSSVLRTRPRNKDRIGSETSISSRSRPPSYSSWYTEDSVFSERLDDLKERYSENSEFLASIRRQRLSFNSTESFTKESLDGSTKTFDDNEAAEKQDVTNEKELSSQKLKQKERKTKLKVKQSKSGGHFKLKSTILPPIPVSHDEYSAGDTTCLSSNSTSSNNGRVIINNYKENRRPSQSKKRKVEFNFNIKPKRSVRLPPLPSTSDHKPSRKPKSILKKQDCSESPSPLSHTKISEEEDDTTSTSVQWKVHLPKLRSPVPMSGGRRQPIAFQSHNLLFNCSKEFEAAAVDEIEPNMPL